MVQNIVLFLVQNIVSSLVQNIVSCNTAIDSAYFSD